VRLGELQFRAVVNGRRSLNGAVYGCTITGAVEVTAAEVSLYDVLSTVAGHVAEQNGEMELPEAIQVTIFPTQKGVVS
jgi:hypothetical protein